MDNFVHALFALSMRFWDCACRANAFCLRFAQPFQESLTYSIKMALRVDQLDKINDRWGEFVITPWP